ncbi:HK97 gp10 family phage protein [Mesorhizobium neociceri]|uniref:HK97 gp10 family phage protein n=1 Tax=Mesorhizobium neociceri TaxID=1307853 RepID=A0A838B0B3_9HYPH|nr:HK97 gp10 family phage protein [Mesorhizobium neociceri]MBA1139362.1 HK97 gp10 family phage protein [Mesorhizobium neociceri]
MKALDAIPKAAKAAIQPAIDRGADELVARMRYLAPDETGELQASIRSEPGPRPLSRTVFTDNDAALYQEYGTRKMPANPFFGCLNDRSESAFAAELIEQFPSQSRKRGVNNAWAECDCNGLGRRTVEGASRT